MEKNRFAQEAARQLDGPIVVIVCQLAEDSLYVEIGALCGLTLIKPLLLLSQVRILWLWTHQRVAKSVH